MLRFSSITPSRLWASALLGLAFSFNTASAWWNGEWTLRKPIVIDTTDVGGDALGGVPVLVRLHEGNFAFDQVKSDGTDLRFVAADDKTLLPYHIEKLDTVLNEAFVWVKVPDLKAGGKTTIYLYYGNAGNKAVKVEDPKGTYDAETTLVYHFGEHAQAAYDFSGNGNGTQSSGVATDGAIIGTGLHLDGKTPLTVAGSASFAWADHGNLTWSAWVRPTTLAANQIIFSRRENGHSFIVGIDNGVPFAQINDGSGNVRTQAGAPIAANTWKHLAVIAGSSRVALLVDGENYASVSASLPALNGDALMGESFTGDIDELEISKTARSVGFVKFAAYSQGGERGAKMIALGADEQETGLFSALKTGYVGVIIGSLTVDGWVVIGLLAVMSGISWYVMIRKGLVLNKVGKGNEAFVKEWSQVATNLSVLDEHEEAKTMGGRLDPKRHRSMRDSSLYKIYHVGIEEIRHRHSSDPRGSANVLSTRSIEAIKASLDGVLTRETQKLNTGMVLLTIAISGGPFLGLLGTVVGVMITFAAVAQAGDVNVNAIAPGIAAALAATVAGLAVAIPALFGYNYLLTRIKSATTDMHVFIDEFITKLAEFYSESVTAE